MNASFFPGLSTFELFKKRKNIRNIFVKYKMSFAYADYADYAGKRKQPRSESFLIEKDQVVARKRLIALIEPYYPKSEGGHPAYPLLAILWGHMMQNWFGYSDPERDESLYETTILRQFTGLNLDRIPYETMILNFRRLLEQHELAPVILQVINGYLGDSGLMLLQGTEVDQEQGQQTRLRNARNQEREKVYFDMKAHIGVDTESGLAHNLMRTAANGADATLVDQLLHR